MEYVLIATVDCTATGTREGFLQMLDALQSGYPAVRVRSFSFSDASYLTEALTEQVSTQISFSLEIYMCGKGAK